MKVAALFLMFGTLVGPLVPLVSAGQDWFNLKMKWTPFIFGGFQDKPRTVEDAKRAGWIQISDGCNGESRWPGLRYVPPEAEPSMVLIYDINGFIAGMQSVVPEKATMNDKYYDFKKVSMYNLDDLDVNGNVLKALLTTAYFVKPKIICNGGRSQDEFDREGTGRTLILQNGPSYDDQFLEVAPSSQANASNHLEWNKHKCFLNMGVHYLKPMNGPKEDCRQTFPVQLLYDHQGEQELIGFVWRHFVALDGNSWEVPDKRGIGFIVKDPPACIYELSETPGTRSMHVYFKSWLETCLF